MFGLSFGFRGDQNVSPEDKGAWEQPDMLLGRAGAGERAAGTSPELTLDSLSVPLCHLPGPPIGLSS